MRVASRKSAREIRKPGVTRGISPVADCSVALFCFFSSVFSFVATYLFSRHATYNKARTGHGRIYMVVSVLQFLRRRGEQWLGHRIGPKYSIRHAAVACGVSISTMNRCTRDADGENQRAALALSVSSVTRVTIPNVRLVP